MTKPKLRIVEPSSGIDPHIEAERLFLSAGWSASDATWLTKLCLRSMPFDQDTASALTDVSQAFLRGLASAWTESGPHDRRSHALLTVFVRLCGCGGNETRLPWPNDREPGTAPLGLVEWREIAQALRAHRPGTADIDFESALVKNGWPGNYGPDNACLNELHLFAHRSESFYERTAFVRMVEILVKGAEIDLTRVVSASLLSERGRWVSPVPSAGDVRCPVRHPIGAQSSAPDHLDPWMFVLGPSVLAKIQPLVFGGSPEESTTLALGARDAFERWLSTMAGHHTYFHRLERPQAEPLRTYATELERMADDSVAPVGSRLRKAWIWYMLAGFESDRNALQNERREKLLRAVTEEVAQLRKLFARASDSAEEYSWQAEHLHDSVFALSEFGGLWGMMKPLLLAIRALNTPCVAKDLRYWDEQGMEPVPTPWNDLPRYLINLFHFRAAREESQDKGLSRLRGELSQFCLDRLLDRWSKSKRESAVAGTARTNDDMVERSPFWRLCLVKAVVSLGINPEGKAHRVLYMSSQIDPDPDVRDAARQAYAVVHRDFRLSDDTSPRRAVMSALWWIRQAHLLGLEIQPDRDGAQRTRIKELTRTKEAERDANPANA